MYGNTGFQEVGVPVFQRITREGITLGASSTNLMIDQNGMPFLVANGVVYTFNGSSWQALTDPNDKKLIGLSVTALGPDGDLYAALIEDWGILKTGQSTHWKYNSTKPLECDTSTFSLDIRKMFFNSKGELFLLSNVGVLRHSEPQGVNIWNHIGDSSEYFEVNGKEFISTRNQGFFQISGNEMIEFPIPKIAGQFPTITKSIPFRNGVLLASYARGLFFFDGIKFTPWKTSLDDEFGTGIRDMVQLPTGEITIAIRDLGLVILNDSGEEITRLTGESEKTFSNLMQIAADDNGVIWARTLSDTIKIHFPATITKIDQSLGFVPNWTGVRRINGKIHLLTVPDLFVGHYKGNYLTHFEKLNLPGKSAQYINSFDSLGKKMVVGTENGIFIYDEHGKASKISDMKGAFLIDYHHGKTDTICAVGDGMITMLEKIEDKWKQIGEPVADKGLINLMISDSDGNYWIEGGNSHVFKVSRDQDSIKLETFDETDGLINGWINLFLIQGKTYISVRKEILQFDDESNKFIPSPKLTSQLVLSDSYIQRPAELSDGSLVVPNEQGLIKLDFLNGNYVPSNDSFELLSSININLTVDNEDKIWISAPGDLYLYNPDRMSNNSGLLEPEITTVSSYSNKTHTLIFYPQTDLNQSELKWPYQNNSFEVNFFNRDYHLVAPAKHQYILKGLSNDWSTPTSQRKINFTNLHEGNYTLFLRAIDIRGNVSKSTVLTFTILPPYYRTPLAFLTYILVVSACLIQLFRFFNRHQIREKNHLESVVKNKTAALQLALKTAKKATEAKSMFLANMSHEIRTPMNAVIGLTQILSESELNDTQQHHLRTIKTSGESLISIINDILDYSKLEAGQLTLEYIPTDMTGLVGDVMDLLQDKAETENIEFNYLVDEAVSHTFRSDPLRVKQVLLNLVGNALKFTAEGEIFVQCTLAPQASNDNQTFIRISIQDTGIGIAQHKIGKLFKVFSQLDTSTTRMFGGTGLGLAISRYIIEKMGGRIWVESELGEYAEFIVEIPFDKCAPSKAFNPYFVESFRNKNLKIGFTGVKKRSKQILTHYLNTWGIECVDETHSNSAQILINEDMLCESTKDTSRICLLGIQNKLNNSDLHDSVTLVHKPIHPQFIYKSILKAIGVKEKLKKKSAELIIPNKFAEDYPLNILVVEDNMINQRVIKLLLKNLGYSAEVANNGQEAFHKIEECDFDVVLMDLQMPVMDGMTATREIRKLKGNDHTPWIIAQSASALLETEGGIVAAGGMNDFISKPIIGKALRASLVKAHNHLSPELTYSNKFNSGKT